MSVYRRGGIALPPGRDVVVGDLVIPFANLDAWSTTELAAHGITRREAPAPSPVEASRRVSFLEFMDLFSPAEQRALKAASMADIDVGLWYDRALGASFIDLDDARTIAGVGVMAALGLLTNARAEAVLDGLAP